MQQTEIAQLRLAQQKIHYSNFETSPQVVAHLGAMQAQDFQMAKWAIGTRLAADATDRAVEQAIDRAEIFRTHILRPTWHFVAAEDYRWMLQIGTPQVKKIINSSSASFGLTPEIFEKSNRLIEKMLVGRQLTRDEIMSEIARANIPTGGIPAAHLMMHAELTGLVVNGSWRSKQLTYALLDERLPSAPLRPLDECLGLLAGRYFQSHVPATVRDFQWWSGLTAGEARRGTAMLGTDFFSEKIDGKEYWLPQSADFEAARTAADSLFLLPAFDEFLIAYTDRAASLEPARGATTITSNGIFKPVVVAGGQVVGLWKRTLKKDRVLLDFDFFDEKSAPAKPELERASQRFAEFLSLKLG